MAVGMEQGLQILYIYISTTESISFADRFNMKEKVLYKGWLETNNNKKKIQMYGFLSKHRSCGITPE